MTMTATAQEVIPMRTTALEFAEICRALHLECHRLGIVAPAFRSPPHTRGPRSIHRYRDGVVVLVRLDRDPHSVTADLVDGIIAANPEVEGDVVELVRTALWEAAGTAVAA